MKTEELMSIWMAESKESEWLQQAKQSIPLGVDVTKNVVYSQKNEKPFNVRHTCVTGNGRRAFLRRLIMTTSYLYKKNEACFFILSTKPEYGELLKLQGADVTVPYLRSKEDLDEGLSCLKEMIRMRAYGEGYPHLFLVLDGLEDLQGCNKNGDLEEYRNFLEQVARRTDVDVFTGVDLLRSIFSGYPGAFVGIGNSLVTTRGEGKADLTYVNDDSSMTLPTVLEYPDAPSLTESIIYFNSLSSEK